MIDAFPSVDMSDSSIAIDLPKRHWVDDANGDAVVMFQVPLSQMADLVSQLPADAEYTRSGVVGGNCAIAAHGKTADVIEGILRGLGAPRASDVSASAALNPLSWIKGLIFK